mmetsp:Transcript_12157/g.34211  ORF Transcript_12157/g.34211 Transcript_12157/m.34211 type:complete len:481 (-) Transcript_12157:70-1512(-)|eukprot:CAMPEP_0117652072 /NCGR_PEP_ID=MMETSP0804-20121206/2433_1 /TAXON_ID=1074897 /ORGANISM="Tetraselmis astigmatica, Strain CCMP880" /LENGTH=480 /DNA_ID=CAMNT_0005458097 /DNA_START=43 /DNA_END=1485 /DNA_ORIENTATION=-
MATASGAGSNGWYFLGPSGQPEGPMTTSHIKAMVTSGSLLPSTMVWKTGMSEWATWESQQQQQPPSEAPPATSKPAVKAAVISAAPAARKPTDPEDELASFLGEISALEQEAEQAKAGGAEDGQERPESPSPEDREFIDDDGTKYRWDSTLRAFKPVEDIPAYTEEDMVFKAEDEVIPTVSQAKAAEAAGEEPLTGVKRQRAEAMQAQKDKIAKAKEEQKRKDEEKKAWFDLKKNTNVYVTGLPDDATIKEMKDVFGRCGIIKENEDRTPKIKLYTDKATGMLKGDGLVTFLREPSVELACTILDGAPLRPGGPPLSVTVAKFEMKKDHQPRKKQPAKKQKKNVVVNQEKYLGWDGFDDYKKPEQVTVILKNMFTLEQMKANPMLRAELEEDVAAECSKLGGIERLRVFTGNPEGVISIRYKQEEHAEACVKLMNGRFFGGQQVVAHMYDGHTNYNVKLQESEEEQAARLEAYTRSLEGQ